jgi:hypothetical protein
MPEKLEHELKERAKSLHLSKSRANAYVYGTLRKIEIAKAHHMHMHKNRMHLK